MVCTYYFICYFCNQYTLKIVSGVSPGKRIGTIQANDIDSHPHLTYSYKLIGDSNNNNNIGLKPVFNMDKFSGILSLGATPLDRELKDSYKLAVSASDGAHTVHTEVTITVTDENDNRPRYEIIMNSVFQLLLDFLN